LLAPLDPHLAIGILKVARKSDRVQQGRSKHRVAQTSAKLPKARDVAAGLQGSFDVLLGRVRDEILQAQVHERRAAEAGGLGVSSNHYRRNPHPQGVARRGVTIERKGVERHVGPLN
jgi:hypothetical protein